MTAPHKSRAYFPERTYALVTCVGCNTPLLRDEPGNQTLGPTNWMRNCDGCQRRLCGVCFVPDAASRCVECKAALARIELQSLLTVGESV